MRAPQRLFRPCPAVGRGRFHSRPGSWRLFAGIGVSKAVGVGRLLPLWSSCRWWRSVGGGRWGVMPRWRRKARRRVSSLPNPLCWAAEVTLCPSRRSCWARSRRLRSTQRAGVAPGSARKSRVRWRELRAAARAMEGRPWSPAGSFRTELIRVRSGSLRAAGVVNGDCPPGRWRKTTSSRAMWRAVSAPWSFSTRASARSMPAVIPAEVTNRPSWTWMASGWTRTRGGRRAAGGWSRGARPAGRVRPGRRHRCTPEATRVATVRVASGSSVSGGVRSGGRLRRRARCRSGRFRLPPRYRSAVFRWRSGPGPCGGCRVRS